MSTGVSTGGRWAGALSPGAFVDLMQRAGAAGILVDETVSAAFFAELGPLLRARRAELPVWGVENVCPASRRSSAELGALDREEALVAREAAEETVRYAEELGGEGACVLLRLGQVAAARSSWTAVRRAFLRGELEGSQEGERLRRDREAYAGPHVDVLRRSLERLARVAEAHGVWLGVRNPARFVGVPSPDELSLLASELRGAPLHPVLDLPAAHLGDAMGLLPLADTLSAWRGAPLLLVADACAQVGGLPPGRGELDLRQALEQRAPGSRLVFTPSSRLEEREVTEGIAAVQRLSLAKAT